MRYLFVVLISTLLYNSLLWGKEGNLNNEDPEPYIVDITAVNHVFAMPSEIKSGWVTSRFTNSGDRLHNAYVGRVQDSIDVNLAKELLLNYDYSFLDVAIGGPGVHSPGAVSQQTVKLEPGHYLIVCFRSDNDQSYHMDKGMFHFFEVVSEWNEGSKPEADAKIKLSEFDLTMSGTLNEGKNTFSLKHKEGIGGGFHLVNLDEAGGLSETLLGLEKQPEKMAGYLGGTEPAAPGREVFMTFDLNPGRYAWLSYNYAAFGMYQVFEVPEELPAGDQHTVSIQPSSPDVIFTLGSGEQFKETYELVAGPNQLSFLNEDSVAHKVELQRMRPGVSTTEVQDYFKGNGEDKNGKLLESPVLGFYMQFPNTDPGSKGELHIDLLQGSYTLIKWKKTSNSGWDIESVNIINVQK